jgi:hypothetical protein
VTKLLRLSVLDTKDEKVYNRSIEMEIIQEDLFTI